MDELLINGNIVKMTKTAFRDLMNLVGLTQKMVKHLNDTIGNNAGYSLMQEVMKAMEKQGGRTISLVVCEEAKKVVRFADNESFHQSIAPDVIEDLIMYAVDNKGKIAVTNKLITDGGTKVSFQLNYDDPIRLAIPGEEIKFGKQITWDLLGPTMIEDLVERLVCRNGMTGIVPRGGTPMDGGSTPGEWYMKLYEELANPSKSKVNDYEAKVFNAIQTNLSVHEFNRIYAFVTQSWTNDKERIVKYLGNGYWRSDYEKLGHKLEGMSIAKLKNCPTPVNSWDGINVLTDLASHREYESSVSDKTRIKAQSMAGRLLNRNWDENQQILNVPNYRSNGPIFDDTTF